jgi:hypothetical protein
MYMDSSNCDISTNELSCSPKNDYIDEITLQLLINKQCKSKYLMQHDPDKYKEEEEYKEKVKYYKNDIANIFNDYSNIKNHQITSDLDDAYNNFIHIIKIIMMMCYFKIAVPSLKEGVIGVKV